MKEKGKTCIKYTNTQKKVSARVNVYRRHRKQEQEKYVCGAYTSCNISRDSDQCTSTSCYSSGIDQQQQQHQRKERERKRRKFENQRIQNENVVCAFRTTNEFV